MALLDYTMVYFYGTTLWTSMSYFFGSNVKTSMSVLLFIEGGAFLAVGAFLASGLLETTVEGNFARLDPYAQKDVWRQRKEQTEKQYAAGPVLILMGLPLLIAGFIITLA